MNSAPLLFLGIFATLAGSFWGLILTPHLKMGGQELRTIPATGETYPPGRSGLAQQGAEVYRSLGCVECHSQQVRANGPDFARGWGQRISVHQDYLRDYPVMIGSQRIGPDLANVGGRLADSTTLMRLLYNPRLVRPGSMMPRFPFLFDKRRLTSGQLPSPDALPADTEQGFEITPKSEANALVAYVQSLHSPVGLFEAPLPLPPPTNAPAAIPAATNASAAPTR